MSDDQLRQAAVKRLKAQRDFKQLAGIFVIIWGILTGVWWLSGGGYFWPGWAIFGMGIALAFTGWAAYGPAPTPPTEQQINDEMRKMGGQ